MPGILFFAIFFSLLSIFNSVLTEHYDIQNTSMSEVKKNLVHQGREGPAKNKKFTLNDPAKCLIPNVKLKYI